MDTYQIIIICGVIIALLIGAIIYLPVKKKKINKPSEGKVINKISSSFTEIESKNQPLEKEVNVLKDKIKTLETQLKESHQLNEALKSGDTSSFNAELESQLEKIKKQLEEMREELEDAEDEVEDYKKKWRKEKNESEHLKQSLSKSEQELKKISEELKTIELDLKEKSIELTNKQDSIKFVNDILSAPPDDEKDIKEVHRIIDSIQDFVEGSLLDVLKKYNLADKEKERKYKEDIWQWSNAQKKNWIEGKKVVAFVGEFSAGKTSIVNRILSQDNENAPKLPVSSKATTAIATYISHGIDFRSQFTDPRGKLKKIDVQTFEMVKKDILSEINVSSLIQYFVMKYNNENLKEISILDTPGFSSNDSEDAKRTTEVIREADVLFWVFDANVGEINQTSLNTIQENLKEMPLFIVMNKVDTKSPNELNKLEEHIKTTVEKRGISVNGYIRFSQKERIDKLMEAIDSVPHKNNSKVYIKSIFDEVNAWTEQAGEDVKQKGHKFRILDRILEPKTTKMEGLYEEVSAHCGRIIKIPQSKKSFFGLGDEFFRMSKDEYQSFTENVINIERIKNSIKIVCKEVVETTEQITNSEKELQEARRKYNELHSTMENFEKLLKKWDPKFKDL